MKSFTSGACGSGRIYEAQCLISTKSRRALLVGAQENASPTAAGVRLPSWPFRAGVSSVRRNAERLRVPNSAGSSTPSRAEENLAGSVDLPEQTPTSQAGTSPSHTEFAKYLSMTPLIIPASNIPEVIERPPAEHIPTWPQLRNQPSVSPSSARA